MKVCVFKGEDGQWYWHIKSKNNKIICQSEGYQRKGGALKAVKSLKTNLAKAMLVVES
jgi:uncharacterized protein YegP (UPF0339 family)